MKRCLLWLSLGCMVVAGCSSSHESVDALAQMRASQSAVPSATSSIIAKVNGRSLTTVQFEAFWKTRPALTKAQALDAFIIQESTFDAALAAATNDEQPALRLARSRGLTRAWLDKTFGQDITEPKLVQKEVQIIQHDMYYTLYRPAGLQASHLLVVVPKERFDPVKRTFVTYTKPEREQLFEKAKAMAMALRAQLPESPDSDDLEQMRLAQFDQARAQMLDLTVDTHIKFPQPGAKFKSMAPGWASVVPEFANGAATLASSKGVGALSEPVRSDFGYHLIVVEETFDAVIPAPKDVAAQTRRVSMMRTRRQEMDVRLKSLLKTHVWQVYPDALQDPLFSK